MSVSSLHPLQMTAHKAALRRPRIWGGADAADVTRITPLVRSRIHACHVKLADGEEIVGRDGFLVAEALLIAAAMLCRHDADSNANDMEQLLNGWFDPLELASWMNDGEPLGPKPAA